MEVKLHFKRYYVFTKYKYISQQLKIPTVQQGTTTSDVLEPIPHPLTLLFPPLCKMPGTPPSFPPLEEGQKPKMHKGTTYKLLNLVLCCLTGRDAIGISKIVAI